MTFSFKIGILSGVRRMSQNLKGYLWKPWDLPSQIRSNFPYSLVTIEHPVSVTHQVMMNFQCAAKNPWFPKSLGQVTSPNVVNDGKWQQAQYKCWRIDRLIKPFVLYLPQVWFDGSRIFDGPIHLPDDPTWVNHRAGPRAWFRKVSSSRSKPSP